MTTLPWSFPATRDGEDGTKGHQHHAALPCCTMETSSMGPCRMSLCRSPQWAEARRGACFQPAGPLSLPHPGNAVAKEMERAGVPGLGRPGRGELLQALAVSNVTAHKLKQI